MEVCEIARLPEELVSAAVARTSPRDACRAAAVSRPFRAAADSDAVWARFLPPGALPPLADGELADPAPPASKKELFLRLSAGPALLQDRLVSMWLDRETGTKCYMLSARNLFIVWGDTPQYWSWIPLDDSRKMTTRTICQVCGSPCADSIESATLFSVYFQPAFARSVKMPMSLAHSCGIVEDGLAGVRLGARGALTACAYKVDTDGRIVLGAEGGWRDFLVGKNLHIGQAILITIRNLTRHDLSIIIVIDTL